MIPTATVESVVTFVSGLGEGWSAGWDGPLAVSIRHSSGLYARATLAFFEKSEPRVLDLFRDALRSAVGRYTGELDILFSQRGDEVSVEIGPSTRGYVPAEA